jgi:hypothetical protein
MHDGVRLAEELSIFSLQVAALMASQWKTGLQKA